MPMRTVIQYFLGCKHTSQKVFLGLLLLSVTNLLHAQGGLIVNEFSNGPAGSEEFWELVVVGDPGNPTADVDVTNWILDDNDGTFGTAGVANGYIQITGNCFSTVAPGSIILIYNAGDPREVPPDTPLPANDPTDTNPADGVFVVATNTTSDGGAPTAANACFLSCPSTSYATSCTGTPTYGPTNSTIGMANGGDAVQTREPDGTFFHGFSYGTGVTSGSTITLPGSGTNQVYSFTCGDYLTTTNMDSNGDAFFNRDTVSAATETPGAANNDANAAFLALVEAGTFNYAAPNTSCNATTPVTLSYFTSTTTSTSGDIHFQWSTSTETANLGFDVYAEIEGQRQLLNTQLIASNVVDSVTPQDYAYTVSSGINAQIFWLADTDTRGQETFHGPYELGQSYGRPSEIEPIAWSAIAAEHDHKANQRKISKRNKRKASHSLDELKLLVERDGLYRISHEQLLAADYDLSGTKGRDIALSNRGVSIPITVHTTGKGKKFGPGSYIEFIGTAIDSLYSSHNVYVLSVDRSAAKRTASVNATPAIGVAPETYYLATTEVADQNQYSFASPNGDPWYDDRLLATSGPLSRDYTVSIDHFVSSATNSTLNVDLWGVTNFPQTPDHHVVVAFNGVDIADERFDGLVDFPISANLANGNLRDGNNTLTLRLPHDTGALYDLVNLEGFSLTYPRAFVAQADSLSFTASGQVFEVTGLSEADVKVYRQLSNGAVEQLNAVEISSSDTGQFNARFTGTTTPATYYVTTAAALLAPDLGSATATPINVSSANYHIIAHADFIGADLNRLVAAREADGYSVAVVDVERLYATYSHNITDPIAIQAYLTEAHAKGAEYVLLVGGDTYDYHDYLNQAAVSFIPSLYAQTDALVRYAPVDPLYTDINGDNIPDMAIGRFPVRNSTELATMVDQTLNYGKQNYRQTAVFAADAYDQGQGYDFAKDSDDIIDQLPLTWQFERAYVDDLGVGKAKATLLDSINNGVALTSFFGHSGPTVWTFSGLLNSTDVATLGNVGKPTVVTQWGCWNTYYVSPSATTLGHSFMLNGNRGAAAVLGASTLTQAAAEKALAQHVFAVLLKPGMTLGKAVQVAKQNYAETNPTQLDVILGWTLLGDPTLVIEP